jgi:FkbM family methyltransferase
MDFISVRSMIKILKKVFPSLYKHPVIKYLAGPFIKNYRPSYSQCGEDMILDVILKKKEGFYIDIGANNPIRQSNTMYFYKKGWHGINIDATPGAMISFRKLRKRDLNLEVAVASEETEMIFYLFKSSLYNTFNQRLSDEFNNNVVDQKILKTQKLSTILDQYLSGNKEIDFLSIDTEGYDHDILKSNNWTKYRPKVIVTENLVYSKDQSFAATNDFLITVGYTFFCNSPTNAFFLENKFLLDRFMTS